LKRRANAYINVVKKTRIEIDALGLDLGMEQLIQTELVDEQTPIVGGKQSHCLSVANL
jgi:hypothetical protein